MLLFNTAKTNVNVVQNKMFLCAILDRFTRFLVYNNGPSSLPSVLLTI